MGAIVPILFVAGLFGVIVVSRQRGDKKPGSIEGDVFDFGFDPLIDLYKHQWWTISFYNRQTGRYGWTAPKFLNFSERVDYSMSLPSYYQSKSPWYWTGTKWVQEIANYDPRYGDQRVASR